MRPSISVALEPGLERGVPSGRDLFTFVTSAAGHMMRTLQKPRKNRPSKRQVNHRRFLHNMIQRKFADMEAANHRLATALNVKEEDKKVSPLPSQELETLDQTGSPSNGVFLQDPDKCSGHTGADGISTSGTDVSEKTKKQDSRYLWKRQPKSQPADQKKESRNHKLVEFTPTSSPADQQHGAELLQTECHDNESPLQSANDLSGNSPAAELDSGFIPSVDISPVFSPELSPLSLDSCDFTDISTYTQTQRSIADFSESQWTDIMDLFSVGSKEFGGCTDVEAYFESICVCQGDALQEVGADDVAFADSLTESHEVAVDEAGESGYEYGYSCHGDEGSAIHHFLRQNDAAAETQLNNFRSSGLIQNQLQTSTTPHCDASELQTFQLLQEESPCMLANHQNFTPFEGVAQSFLVPPLTPEHRPIRTPPHEDDWLFTDILQDRKSPDC